MATNEHKAAPMQMNEYEDVPAQEFEEKHTVDPVNDEYPQTKSSVGNAREVVMQNAKFKKNDWVNMSVIANGRRSKGIFQIYNSVYNPAGWVDYQLLDAHTGQLYNRGAAVRERDLKAGT